MKINISISQPIAKIILKEQRLNQVGRCLTGHNQI